MFRKVTKKYNLYMIMDSHFLDRKLISNQKDLYISLSL